MRGFYPAYLHWGKGYRCIVYTQHFVSNGLQKEYHTRNCSTEDHDYCIYSGGSESEWVGGFWVIG